MKTQVPYSAVVSARFVAVAAFVWDPLNHTVRVLARVRAESGAAVAIAIAVLALRYAASSRAFAARRLVVSVGWLTAGLLAAAGTALWPWLRLAGEGVPRPALIATIAASVLAGPVAQGAWAALLTGALWGYLRNPSDEGVDQSAIVGATWVIVTQVARSWLSDGAPPEVLTWTLHVTVPSALALIAFTRVLLRRRWLSAVSSRRHSQWRLFGNGGVGHDHLPAATPTVDGAPCRILVRVHAPQAPFRDAERLEPRARIGCITPA